MFHPQRDDRTVSFFLHPMFFNRSLEQLWHLCSPLLIGLKILPVVAQVLIKLHGVGTCLVLLVVTCHAVRIDLYAFQHLVRFVPVKESPFCRPCLFVPYPSENLLPNVIAIKPKDHVMVIRIPAPASPLPFRIL